MASAITRFVASLFGASNAPARRKREPIGWSIVLTTAQRRYIHGHYF